MVKSPSLECTPHTNPLIYHKCYETTGADKHQPIARPAPGLVYYYVAATTLPFYIIQLVIFQQQHSYSSDQPGGKVLPPFFQGHAYTTLSKNQSLKLASIAQIHARLPNERQTPAL